MSRSGSNGRRRDAGRVTPCGVGLLYEVSPGTVGVLAPKSANLDHYFGSIPNGRVVDAMGDMSNVLVPLIHMPEVAGVLRKPSSAEATALRRGRLW
jgi:hypothetical protein